MGAALHSSRGRNANVFGKGLPAAFFSPKLLFHCSEDRVHVSMDSFEASRERKRALTAELADVHRAAKRLRKREATRRSASARVWLVGGVKLNIALAFLCVSRL